MSSWFLRDCTSYETAEAVVRGKQAGGFCIWPSPEKKGCLVLSHKRSDRTIAHIKIFKVQGERSGFVIEGKPDHVYPKLDALILGLRKSPTAVAARSDSPEPYSPATKRQNGVVEEMTELFPGTSREKIVRATTLANGDKQKVMDLLLTQRVQRQHNKKQASLAKLLTTIIVDSRNKLAEVNQYLTGLKTYEETTQKPAQGMERSLAQVKQLLKTVQAYRAANKRPQQPAATPFAKLAAFKLGAKTSCAEIGAGFNFLERKVKDPKTKLPKLLAVGNSIKGIKQSLDGAIALLSSTQKGGAAASSSGGGGGSRGTSPGLRSRRTADSPKGKGDDPGSPAPPKSFLIPFEELKITKEIGKGAYGKVYLAMYGSRKVAVKSLALLKDERERNWMKREISLLKQVQHPNVTEFLGISKDSENHLLIVMEYVANGELYPHLLSEEMKLTWATRIRWAFQVASALSYMHSRKIIHRDIKSENLLVDEDWNVKLCDFGFARMVEDRKRARMTLCGSPYFNAPELLLGKAYNDRADVFAFGVLLCEIITRGKVNLDRISKEAFNAFALDIESLSSEIPDDCPPAFWKIAICCCNYAPEKRPSMPQVEKLLKALM